MITSEKIDIYCSYRGNEDAYFRSAGEVERRALGEGDWHEIDQLVQRVGLESIGHAAESFIAETNNLLRQRCSGDAAAIKLRQFVSEEKERRSRRLRKRWWQFRI